MERNSDKLHFSDDGSGIFSFLDLAESAIRHQSERGLLNESQINALRNSASDTGYFAAAAFGDLGQGRIEYETDPQAAAASGLVLCAGLLKGLTSIHDALNYAERRLPPPPPL